MTTTAPGAGPVHHHTWVIREALHTEHGRHEQWFECETCTAPHQ